MIEIMSEQVQIDEQEMKRREDRKIRMKENAISNCQRDIDRKTKEIQDIQNFLKEIEDTKGSSIRPLV